jgi:hypothetical protein
VGIREDQRRGPGALEGRKERGMDAVGVEVEWWNVCRWMKERQSRPGQRGDGQRATEGRQAGSDAGAL